MPESGRKALLRRGVEAAVRGAFTRAYHTIKVDPEKYIEHLRMAYGLPVISYAEVSRTAQIESLGVVSGAVAIR